MVPLRTSINPPPVVVSVAAPAVVALMVPLLSTTAEADWLLAPRATVTPPSTVSVPLGIELAAPRVRLPWVIVVLPVAVPVAFNASAPAPFLVMLTGVAPLLDRAAPI